LGRSPQREVKVRKVLSYLSLRKPFKLNKSNFAIGRPMGITIGVAMSLALSSKKNETLSSICIRLSNRHNHAQRSIKTRHYCIKRGQGKR